MNSATKRRRSSGNKEPSPGPATSRLKPRARLGPPSQRPSARPSTSSPPVSAVQARKAKNAQSNNSVLIVQNSASTMTKIRQKQKEQESSPPPSSSSGSPSSDSEQDMPQTKPPRPRAMSVDPVDASCSSLPDSLFSLSNLPVAPQPQSKSKHNDRYFVKTEAGRKKRQTPVVDLSADTDQDSDIDEVSDSEPERAAAGTHQQQRTELSPSSNRAPSPPLRAPNPHPEAKPKPSMSLIDGQNLTQLDASVLDQQSRQLLGLKDSNDAKGVLVCLKSAESFHVCGQSKLSVLKGEIECHGARLLSSDAQPIDIFAPITHVLPCFTTSRRPQSSSKSSRFLSCLTSAPEALEHTSILDLLHTFDAVLLLTPHSCSGIEAVEDQLKLGHMFSRSSNLWKGRQAAYNASSFQLYTETPSMQDLAMATTLPEDWDDIIQRVEADFGMMQQGIVTAVGPKRSGKSTLGKAMVNRLLQSHRTVAWLDLDLGQAEFTPPGLVSLHFLDQPLINPNFTHMRKPYRAHFIGDTSFSLSQDHYLAAVRDLMKTFHETVKQEKIPLVVNVFGSSKGLPADLLGDIMGAVVQPTHILRFSHTSVHAAPYTKTLDVPALSDLSTKQSLSAAGHRTLCLLSALHSTGRSGEWDFGTPISAAPFYSVRWSDPAFHQIHIPGHEVSYDHALYALNATIVGLVASKASPAVEGLRDGAKGLPYSQMCALPDPTESSCVGLGIIRSINPEKSELHVYTSVPPQDMVTVNTLVRATFEVPTVSLIYGGTNSGLHGVPWTKVPYLESNTALGSAAAGTTLPGEHKRHVRRNVQRNGQHQ